MSLGLRNRIQGSSVKEKKRFGIYFMDIIFSMEIIKLRNQYPTQQFNYNQTVVNNNLC